MCRPATRGVCWSPRGSCPLLPGLRTPGGREIAKTSLCLCQDELLIIRRLENKVPIIGAQTGVLCNCGTCDTLLLEPVWSGLTLLLNILTRWHFWNLQFRQKRGGVTEEDENFDQQGHVTSFSAPSVWLAGCSWCSRLCCPSRCRWRCWTCQSWREPSWSLFPPRTRCPLLSPRIHILSGGPTLQIFTSAKIFSTSSIRLLLFSLVNI